MSETILNQELPPTSILNAGIMKPRSCVYSSSKCECILIILADSLGQDIDYNGMHCLWGINPVTYSLIIACV